eukprot:UN00616
MIGIRENKSWKANKQTKQNDSYSNEDRKPDFDLAYKLIDDVIDILTKCNDQNYSNEKYEKDENNKNEAEIMRFGVSNTCKRKGIGTTLLNHVKEFCIDNGYKSIIASTMNVLKEAILFYKSTGFVLEHTEPCGNNAKLEFLRFRLTLII